MYPSQLFTSKDNEHKWAYLLRNEDSNEKKYPEDKIGKFSHWSIIKEPEITISKIQFHNDEVQATGGAPNTKFTAMQAGYLWQFSLLGHHPYILLNKQAGGLLTHGEYKENVPYKKLQKGDQATTYKKGLDGLEFAYRFSDVPNGYRALTDEDVFNRTAINGYWYGLGPSYNHLQGPAQADNKTNQPGFFKNEDQLRLNFTWGNIYNHASIAYGGTATDLPGQTIGNSYVSTYRKPFQAQIKDVANFKSIYAGDIVKIHCNTGTHGRPMAAGIPPFKNLTHTQAYDWGKTETTDKIQKRCLYDMEIKPIWPRKNLPAVKKSIFNDLHMQLAAQQCNERSNIQFITIAPQKDRKEEMMKISVTFTVETRWKMRCYLDCSMESMGRMGDGNGKGTGSYEALFEENEIQLPWQLISVKPKAPFDKTRATFNNGGYMFIP